MLFNNGNVLPKAAFPKVPKDNPLCDKKEEASNFQGKVNEDDKTIEQFNDYPTGDFTGTWVMCKCLMKRLTMF